MTTISYTKQIRDFVVSNFLFGDEGGLRNDASLVQAGVVDSTGILELVMFLENVYGIKVLDREMVPENLGSIDAAAAFVARKCSMKNAGVL